VGEGGLDLVSTRTRGAHAHDPEKCHAAHAPLAPATLTPTFPMPELKAKDLTRCAAILADAVEEVDGRELTTVDTAFGRADVVVDDHAADVDLHRGPTVHVRFDE
jgi:hypothetical protein